MLKRIWMPLVFAAMLALALTGCSAPKAADPAQTTAPSSASAASRLRPMPRRL